MSSDQATHRNSVLATLRTTYGIKARYDLSDSVVSRYVYRPLSFYLTVPFVFIGLTPNQVSFIGLGISITGMGLIATGRPSAVLWGTVLCAFQVIVDYVDGNIARLRGVSSHLGKFVDGVVDTFIGVILPLAVGIGLWRNPDPVLQRLFGPHGASAALFLAMCTSISTALRSFLVFRLRAAQWDARASSPSPTDPPAVQDSRGRAHRAALWIEVTLRNEMFTMLTAIVFFAWARALGAYLIIRGASALLTLGLEVLRTATLARRSLGVSRAM